MPRKEIDAFIREIKNSRKGREKAAHLRRIPAAGKKFAEPASGLSPLIRRCLQETGAVRLYSHQAEAVNLSRGGKNVLVSTPTSSGKTLIYNLLVFESLLEAPGGKALYIYPAKALARDQLKTASEFSARLGSPERAEVYDGDTPRQTRAVIRKNPPGLLFTNPDMLHSGILAYHGSWAEFFRNLRYVVLDELHAYRGVFGCHVASVIRRLRRIAGFYGSSPRFIASSATMENGAEFSRRLTGLDFSVVSDSGAPRGDRHFIFWDPGEGSPYTDASFLLESAVSASLKTIVFTKSRKITELIYAWTVERNPGLKKRISAYRAGYLPEERREIEKKLFGDELDAVIATSALELGIDVGGLDCCILAGYPGSVISSWQRAGRAGRGEKTSLIIMAALPDALDRYFVRNPDKFFNSGFESVVIDELNEPVLSRQLVCAASELPFSREDFKIFGDVGPVVKKLVRGGGLFEAEDGSRWHSPSKYPHREVNIRAIGENYAILDSETGKLIGDISSVRVFSECHPGAVYLHRGGEYEVLDLNLQKRAVYAKKAAVDYYTQTTSSETVRIETSLRMKKTGSFTAQAGSITVSSRVVSWEKRRSYDGALLGEHKLNLPERTFETQAAWFELPGEAARLENIQGGLHAVEHAAIALLPVFSLCDRWDVGGVSTVFHPQCGGPAIFIYDGYPGGVGLSFRAYEKAEELLKSSLDLIQECGCLEGCPSCIQSPRCGSRNEPLDRACAVRILKGGMPARAAPGIGKQVQPPPHGRRKRPARPAPAPRSGGTLYFDVETQKSAEEVGGWENKRLMRISVAVAYDEKEAAYEVYNETNIGILIKRLFSSSLVVGFNINSFDLEVLRYYSERSLDKITTLDILDDVRRAVGRRISLDCLSEETLGEKKSGSGMDALDWFRRGETGKLIEYCAKDVELTRKLHRFGRENGFLLFRHKKLGKVRIPVDWM